MKKDVSMNEDIAKYPIYDYRNGVMERIYWITDTTSYHHFGQELHHFVRKTMRKNSPDFYKRVEHLQKLILMSKQMNDDLETMGEKRFKEVYGVNKDDFVFSRKKWREGYYDKP